MRSLSARLALATLVALTVAETAAATPVSGTITRGSPDDVVIVDLRNDGSGPDVALDLDFPAGTLVISATLVSGAVGSCTPSPSQPNRLACMFDPPDGWLPGATIRIEVRTSPRLADNAGANAYSCSIPCNPSMKSGPYAVTGPPPPGGQSADLGLSLRRESWETLRNDRGLAITFSNSLVHNLVFVVALANAGPDDASEVDLDFRLRNVVAWTAGELVMETGPDRECDPLTESFVELALRRCSYAAFPNAAASTGTYSLFLARRRAGRREPITIAGSVTSRTTDPDPSDNSVAFNSDVRGSDSGALKLRRGRLISGRAPGARRAFVAIGQERGGARLSEPRPGGPRASSPASRALASAAGCRWVRNAQVRFRNERGRRCDEPSYLRTRVRRGRWRIRLRKGLPPGRYVLISRAVSADGLVESAVGPKLGNLKRFRVR